jgi:hypothetical protein
MSWALPKDPKTLGERVSKSEGSAECAGECGQSDQMIVQLETNGEWMNAQPKSKGGILKMREGENVERIGLLVSIIGLVVSLGLSIPHVWGAEGVIRRVPVPGTNHCRLRFPAIREDTLFSGRPELKDPSDGDIIDFYGSCDYDPLGKEEVARQRAQLQRDRYNEMERWKSAGRHRK